MLAAAARGGYRSLMDGKPQSEKGAPRAKNARVQNARAERLAVALRANLKRRKQQAKIRAAAKPPAASAKGA